jgi:hypothetical protein
LTPSSLRWFDASNRFTILKGEFASPAPAAYLPRSQPLTLFDGATGTCQNGQNEPKRFGGGVRGRDLVWLTFSAIRPET